MKEILIITCALFIAISASANMAIESFSTDGCSAFIDGHQTGSRTEWRHCCVIHDVDYWMGGTKQQKKQSDKELNTCVSEVVNPAFGAIIELAVSIAGKPGSLPWRWGYGWEKGTEYGTLSKTQYQSITQELDYLIDTIAIEKLTLSKEQIDHIAFKLKNEITDLFIHIPGDTQTRELEYKRLILKADSLSQL